MARVIKTFHGKDRARFHAVNRALVNLKNRNAKIPLAAILTEPELVKVNDIITKMNALLAQTSNV